MNSFFDSNILLYLLAEGPKTARSVQLIERGGTVSVQVLNEFIAVALRKFKLNLDEADEVLGLVRSFCAVVDLSLAVHERAVEIARLTNFHIFDCNIVAAAELAGCDVLYTEDLNHGQRIGRVTVRNPFVA